MKKTAMLCITLILLTTLLANGVFAQQANPDPDIFIVNYELKKGKYVFNNPVNLSDRAGYDNQPFFHPDGKSLFYSSASNNQNDIVNYEFKSGKKTQITQTVDLEYSPTVIPGNKYFSCIQQSAKDGSQPLMKFPVKGGEPDLIYENGQKVGYHAWGDKNVVAMFILGQPSSLVVYNAETKTSYRLTENIGRSLHKIPKEYAISFPHNVDRNEIYIKKVDLKTKGITTIIKMLPGSQDYAWMPDKKLIMGSGSKLFVYDPKKDTEWKEIADFSDRGINNISRLSVSPKSGRIAFVADEPAGR